MAFGKAAGGLILSVLWAANLARGEQFPVRHEHLRKGCDGTMTVDESGVRFTGANKHAWTWKLQDIQEFTLSPGSIHILTYKDSKLRLGADREYRFTGKVPAERLYALLRDRMDQRFVAALGQASSLPGLALPAKHLGRIVGSEGILSFGAETVAYSTPARDDSRTWRYSDIDSISSSGPFQLTITTLEKDFHFQLKQPIAEARYNELWLQIEKKNGRIQ